MSKELQIVEYEGQRVLTSRQIAELYESDKKYVSNAFNNNKRRFAEGKHYFVLTGDKLKNFRQVIESQANNICVLENQEYKSEGEVCVPSRTEYKSGDKVCDSQNGDYKYLAKTRKLYLWTKKGAMLIAKIIDTDKAWEVCERLVDFYFEVQDGKNEIAAPIAELPEEPPKITYQTSSTPVPKNPSWYERNKRRMNWMCQVNGKNLSSLYHVILKRIGEEYDLNAANRIYEQEKGEPPAYPMDIVNYFPDLARMADAVLDATEKRILEILSKRR